MASVRIMCLVIFSSPHNGVTNIFCRMSNIGAWYNVLYAMMVLSMLTNSLIVGFSSEQLAVWCPWMYETIDNDQFIVSGYGRYRK